MARGIVIFNVVARYSCQIEKNLYRECRVDDVLFSVSLRTPILHGRDLNVDFGSSMDADSW